MAILAQPHLHPTCCYLRWILFLFSVVLCSNWWLYSSWQYRRWCKAVDKGAYPTELLEFLKDHTKSGNWSSVISNRVLNLTDQLADAGHSLWSGLKILHSMLDDDQPSSEQGLDNLIFFFWGFSWVFQINQSWWHYKKVFPDSSWHLC